MRIDSSNIGMVSSRSFTSVRKRSALFASYTVSDALSGNGERRDLSQLLSGQKNGTQEGVNGSLTDMQGQFKSVRNVTRITRRNELEALDKIRQQCIQYLMELFYPHRGAERKDSGEDAGSIIASGGNSSANAGNAAAGVTVTLGKASYSYMEQENTSFQTKGSVVTADGRTIEFNLGMEMSRSFAEHYEYGYANLVQNANMCDPLVINLDGNIAGLSDQKFLFDIDGDGILDRISELNAGSGYLALDKNGDGRINDGNELFGPQSGNGFQDLAEYDSDGNGWIDENDEIWDKLLIWTKDESGHDKLYHLSEKGLGAICLQNASTDFSLNSLRNNQTNGMIRSTGIFLYENGNVGTVQHLDVAK